MAAAPTIAPVAPTRSLITRPATTIIPRQTANPITDQNANGFAVFLGIIVVAGRVISERVGATGAIVGAAAMGLADVDAVTVSMAKLAPQTLSEQSAVFAILTAVATNMLSKLMIGTVIGSSRFALYLAGISVSCFAAAGIALWLTLTLTAP